MSGWMEPGFNPHAAMLTKPLAIIGRTSGISASLAAGALLCSAVPMAWLHAEPPPSPGNSTNVLFINVDQMRFDAMSCAGSPYVSTPNLDRLAKEGVRFTNAMTAVPVCGPARACWHTGLTGFKMGLVSNAQVDDPKVFLGNGSFDQNLAKSGYHTEFHGRWHSPASMLACYENKVTPDYVTPYRNFLRAKLGEAPKPSPSQMAGEFSKWPVDLDLPAIAKSREANRNFTLQHGVETIPDEYTQTAWTASETIDALKRLQGKRFSMTCSIIAPHTPWYVSKMMNGKVDPKMIRIPSTIDDKRENTPWPSPQWWELDALEREHYALFAARYYEMVLMADYEIGRILKALDELDLAKNTLVIFTADHGELLGEHGLQQKLLPYRGSVCVPMMMRLPGRIPAGKTIDNPVSSVDIFPTIFDYTGLPCPENDGLSLRPLIEGKKRAYPDFTFSEIGHDVTAYTMFVYRDWKYVWTHDDKVADMLFDLKNDPDETCNLLGNNPDRSRYADTVKRIRKDMLAWMERIHHPVRDQLAKFQAE